MSGSLLPTSLDHVALWVADRDTFASFACDHLGMHVIERTDKFTLVGSDAGRGKLTLFAAEGPREVGALEAVILRVRDLDSGARAVYTLVFPSDADIERRRISILAPIGTALIGYRVGDRIEWRTPGGTRRLEIEEVLYEPETATA